MTPIRAETRRLNYHSSCCEPPRTVCASRYPGVVLSALLPGIREFRTPLVTGALWAVAFWLLLGERITDSSRSQQFADRFDGIDLPTSVWLAAAGLSAYLIGSLLVVRTSPFSWVTARRVVRRFRWKIDMLNEGKRARRRRFRPVTWFWRSYVIGGRFSFLGELGEGNSSERYLAVDGWLWNEFESMWADGRVPVTRSFGGGCNAPSGFEAFYDTRTIHSHPGFDDSADSLRYSLAESFVREVKQEQNAVEVRIQMRFPEVYAEIDRLKVEGEFRLSIFWPLTLLAGIMAAQWSPWAAVLLVVPPWLVRDGYQRLRQAAEKTWAPLMAREVTSPILDAMEAGSQEDCRNFASRYAVEPSAEVVAQASDVAILNSERRIG